MAGPASLTSSPLWTPTRADLQTTAAKEAATGTGTGADGAVGEDSVDREAYYDGDLGVGGGGGVGSGRWSVLGVSATRAVNLDKSEVAGAASSWRRRRRRQSRTLPTATRRRRREGDSALDRCRAARLGGEVRVGAASLLSDATRSLLVEGSKTSRRVFVRSPHSTPQPSQDTLLLCCTQERLGFHFSHTVEVCIE